MKSVKEIIAALAKEEGVEIVKNVTFRRVYPGEVNPENGTMSLRVVLDKQIPAFIQVDKDMIDDADAKAIELEKIAKAKDATDDQKTEAANARAYADSLEIDAWIEGKSDTIWITNFDVIGSLADNPSTLWLADYLRESPEDIKPILNHANANLICEKVYENQTYFKPFAGRNSTGSFVEHDNIYHTPYAIKLSEYGLDEADDIRVMLREIRKEKRMSKLRNTGRARRVVEEVNDDED